MNTLRHTSKNCWEVYTSPEHTRAIETLSTQYIEFISHCKTERETIAYVAKRLQEAGYSEDITSERFFRILHNKTIFVARKGGIPMAKGIRLIGAHADTPRLDLKQHPLQEQCNIGQAKTHYYGGIRKYQWFARPLALHGVVIKENGEHVSITIGEDTSDPVFTIADLLPHLAASQAETPLAKAFDAEKMNIILGHKPQEEDKKESTEETASKQDTPKDRIKSRILQLLHERYAICEEDLYSAELQAVPAGPARTVGLDGSLIGAYGHDDRICIFTALEAFLEADAHNTGTPAVSCFGIKKKSAPKVPLAPNQIL